MTSPESSQLVATAGDYLRWGRMGTEVFHDALVVLDARSADLPSLLPGWSRRDVVAHVALNAAALCNLLTWARTGVPKPMYPNDAARDRAIAEQSRLTWCELSKTFMQSAARFAHEVEEMPPDAWSRTVRTRTGRTVPADQILWLRAREVWIHAVDLASTTTIDSLPKDFAMVLVEEVTTALRGRPDVPALRLEPADAATGWTVGADEPSDLVSGPVNWLLAWLIGRSDGTGLSWYTPSRKPLAMPPWL